MSAEETMRVERPPGGNDTLLYTIRSAAAASFPFSDV